jgi:hypothetical protein
MTPGENIQQSQQLHRIAAGLTRFLLRELGDLPVHLVAITLVATLRASMTYAQRRYPDRAKCGCAPDQRVARTQPSGFDLQTYGICLQPSLAACWNR